MPCSTARSNLSALKVKSKKICFNFEKPLENAGQLTFFLKLTLYCDACGAESANDACDESLASGVTVIGGNSGEESRELLRSSGWGRSRRGGRRGRGLRCWGPIAIGSEETSGAP